MLSDLEKARLFQQMLQKQEEVEQQKASEKREALRPCFEAFAAKFPLSLQHVNMSMVFAAWRHLHTKGVAPTASDVPENITINIMDFMKNHQRQQAIRNYQQDNAKQYVMSSMHSPPTVEYALPSDNVSCKKLCEVIMSKLILSCNILVTLAVTFFANTALAADEHIFINIR